MTARKGIMAEIVLFNPDLIRLKDNLDSVINQVDWVVLVDNKSNNVDDCRTMLQRYPNCMLIENAENYGVAKALNQGMCYAESNGYDWVLALDQDSVIPQSMVDVYTKYTHDASIGMITCEFVDRSPFSAAPQNPDNAIEEQVSYIDECITSGCMTRVEAWKNVGGYYEPMFIDSVDKDFCRLLREREWNILRVVSKDTRMIHEIGKDFRNIRVPRIWYDKDAHRVRFNMVERPSFNHPPIRYYYQTRNWLLFIKRHAISKTEIKEIAYMFYIVNRYEEKRWQKNVMMTRGILHFIMGRFGRLD